MRDEMRSYASLLSPLLLLDPAQATLPLPPQPAAPLSPRPLAARQVEMLPLLLAPQSPLLRWPLLLPGALLLQPASDVASAARQPAELPREPLPHPPLPAQLCLAHALPESTQTQQTATSKKPKKEAEKPPRR